MKIWENGTEMCVCVCKREWMKPPEWKEITVPLAAPGQKHIWLTLSSQGQKRGKTMYKWGRESMEGCMQCCVYLLKTNLDWGGLFWEQMNLAWDQKNLQTRTHLQHINMGCLKNGQMEMQTYPNWSNYKMVQIKPPRNKPRIADVLA